MATWIGQPAFFTQARGPVRLLAVLLVWLASVGSWAGFASELRDRRLRQHGQH